MTIRVGDTVNLDGIDVYILAAKDEGGTWDSTSEAIGIEYIGIDKNHDLSYYFARSDYTDEAESDSIINTDNKYGYEWGGYGKIIGIQDTAIGTGLSNTNSLIEMNLQPRTDGWYVVWDKIREFRETRSSSWFLPSKDELNLIYEARSNLSNLSTSTTNPDYWSSSEHSSDLCAWGQNFHSVFGGSQYNYVKYTHAVRARLCRYITNSDFYEKKTWIDDELITSTEHNRIETRTKELHSTYEPHEWVNDEIITSERLNNIETQLGTDKTWVENELITKEKLNNIEDQLI